MLLGYVTGFGKLIGQLGGKRVIGVLLLWDMVALLVQQIVGILGEGDVGDEEFEDVLHWDVRVGDVRR